MLLFSAFTLALCKAASGTVSPPSLAELALGKLSPDDLVELQQSPETAHLKPVLERIFHKQSMIELQDSLRRIPEPFTDPEIQAIINENLVNDPEMMVVRYLCGHDASLDYLLLQRCETADQWKVIQEFRKKLCRHRDRFRESMWSPPIPDGEHGEYIRRYRALKSRLQEIIGRGRPWCWEVKLTMEWVGRVIGEPCLKSLEYAISVDTVGQTFRVWKTEIRQFQESSHNSPWGEAIMNFLEKDVQKLLVEFVKKVIRG